MKRLDGKSIVIVGGSTGLGLSAAKACAREGASLVIVGRSPESLEAASSELSELSCPLATLAGDATDSETARKAITLAVEKFGQLDGLYHVAGGSGRRFGDGPLHEVTDEGWDKTFALNLDSIAWSNRAAIVRFMEQRENGWSGSASILNMGSVLGYSPSPRYFTTHAYAATKGAVIGLAKSLAAYYAPYDIRVNVLAPGLVETPMAQRAANDDVIQKFTHHKQPLDGGRIGRPDDSDGTAVFLLSDESKFITGQVLAVDGGWSVTDVGRMVD